MRRDDDLTTPRGEGLVMGDDGGPRLDPLQDTSSLSSSSSLRNADLLGGGGVRGGRPELSNCQSLSLSHWHVLQCLIGCDATGNHDRNRNRKFEISTALTKAQCRPTTLL